MMANALYACYGFVNPYLTEILGFSLDFNCIPNKILIAVPFGHITKRVEI